jgi:hypothetical protein
MDEFPTERTAMRMTTFMIEGTAFIPALRTAITKGEAFASAELLPLRSNGSLYGTKTDTIVRETM